MLENSRKNFDEKFRLLACFASDCVAETNLRSLMVTYGHLWSLYLEDQRDSHYNDNLAVFFFQFNTFVSYIQNIKKVLNLVF